MCSLRSADQACKGPGKAEGRAAQRPQRADDAIVHVLSRTSEGVRELYVGEEVDKLQAINS